MPRAPSSGVFHWCNVFQSRNKDASSIWKRWLPADRWWNLSACVDAGGQFRPIGNDAQYFVSIDGPTPESTEAGIDFLAADAAPGSAKAGEDAIALEMFRGIRRGGFTPGASATSISTLANII